MQTIKENALALLDKVSHTNRIFYYDYLSDEKATEYYGRLKELNGLQ